MNEEELLKYMSFTEDKVIFDKNFYNKVMLPCFDNSIAHKNIIKKLQKENQQLKEQLEASEKARKKSLNKLKLLGKFDGQNYTRSFKLLIADFNELSKILDIDKGE